VTVVVKGQLIVYRANHLSRTVVANLCRKLYGYTDRSQYGRYAYKRPGVLDEIPHIVPLGWRAILITRPGDAQKVVEILKEFQAQTYVRSVDLEEEDLKILRRDPDQDQDSQDQGHVEGGLGEEAEKQEDQ